MFWGFKEIRTEHIPAIVKLAPNARHIINYRKDLQAQLHSAFQQRNSINRLSNQLKKMRQDLENETTFELALEDFSANKFNGLLQWLGINCSYASVLHANYDGGYHSDSRDVLKIVR